MSVQFHAPNTLPQGKTPRYPMYGNLGVLQRWSGHFGANSLTAFGTKFNSVVLRDQ